MGDSAGRWVDRVRDEKRRDLSAPAPVGRSQNARVTTRAPAPPRYASSTRGAIPSPSPRNDAVDGPVVVCDEISGDERTRWCPPTKRRGQSGERRFSKRRAEIDDLGHVGQVG